MEVIGSCDLGERELEPIRYAVEGMIPEGYTVLSAAQKAGKSWMAQQMCLAVAQGSEFLGRKTTKGKAIYIALEDCEKFAQDRQNTIGTKGADGFMYVFDAPPMDMGFTKELDSLTEGMTDLRLVVVDVLKKIEYQPQPRESAVHCDYRTGTELKAWADRHGVSLVAITHNTKENHLDPFNNTSGTVGVTASADAIVMISRENRYDSEALMAITGRRVMTSLTKVRLAENCVWEVVNGDEYHDSRVRKVIDAIVEDGIEDSLSAKQIIDYGISKGITLTESSRAVGTYILKYKDELKDDGVDVEVVKRGSASKLYRFRRTE